MKRRTVALFLSNDMPWAVLDHPDLTSRQIVDMLGFIPAFLSPRNPASAVDQINDSYAHGGGWNRFRGFEFHREGEPADWWMQYAGDPPLHPLAYTTLRQEVILVFPYAWVAVMKEGDEEPNVARID